MIALDRLHPCYYLTRAISLLRRNTLEKNTKNTTNASHPCYHHTTGADSLHYFCRDEPLLHFLFTLLYPSLHIVLLSLALLVNVLEFVEKESESFDLGIHFCCTSFFGLICLKCRLFAEAKPYFLFAPLHPALHIVWQSFNNASGGSLMKKQSENSISGIHFRCASTASSLSLLKRK